MRSSCICQLWLKNRRLEVICLLSYLNNNGWRYNPFRWKKIGVAGYGVGKNMRRNFHELKDMIPKWRDGATEHYRQEVRKSSSSQCYKLYPHTWFVVFYYQNHSVMRWAACLVSIGGGVMRIKKEYTGSTGRKCACPKQVAVWVLETWLHSTRHYCISRVPFVN